jgi:hypothetical protein
MARVKGPLFSVDASGTVASTVVFSRWRGRNYVRRHAIPANPRSAGQTAARTVIAFLAPEWSLMTDADKASWENLAEATNISPFNAFVAANARNWRDLMAPTKTHPAARTTAPGTVGVLTKLVSGRSVQVTVPVAAGSDDWGLALLRSGTTGVSQLTNAVMAAEAGPAEVVFVDGPLEPGTYYYNARVWSADGNLGAIGTQVSATVT